MTPCASIHVISILFLFSCTPAVTGQESVPSDPAGELVYYDMTSLFDLDLKDPVQRRRFWDETHLVASLQGLANRESPKLYIRYNKEPDDFWWNMITAPEGWLHGKKIKKIEGLESLLSHFQPVFKGAVVWDEKVPATSNLASTLAGCEDLLCFRYDPSPDSICQRILHSGMKIPVRHSFVDEKGNSRFIAGTHILDTTLSSTGSLKCDAYLWMIEKLIKPGRVNAQRMGYYLDGDWLNIWDRGAPQNHTLTNHDFVISRKGVFFDLNVWDDEVPCDDPGQKPGEDARTLRALLHAAYDTFKGEGVIHAAGFVPWAYKYTNYGKAGGHHDAVPTEWRYAEILSCFNAFMDADAIGYCAMANASFFQHCPLPSKIPQNSKPTRESLRARGFIDETGKIAPRRYIAHYVGDYDAAAWMYWVLPRLWTDPARGKTPLNWAFNPNLCERFPLGMLWTRTTRTDQDFFIAGDSGAGYLNPGYLSEPRVHSGLPSGMAAWEKHNQAFFDQWDLSLVGFVIDGFAPGLTEEGLDAYSRFSKDGIVAQKIPPIGIHKGMPYLRMKADLPGDPREAALRMCDDFEEEAPQFLVYRSILMSPDWYLKVSNELAQASDGQAEVVDMYTLFALIREFVSHPELYTPPPSPYRSAREVLAEPENHRGARPVKVDDGPFRLTEQGGTKAWQAGYDPGKPYLYFRLDDDFTKGCSKYVIEVTFLDEGQGTVNLEYDSTDRNAAFGGAYKSGPAIRLSNSGTWQTQKLAIEDARFQNSQNRGADFRISPGGRSFVVSRIRVEKACD